MEPMITRCTSNLFGVSIISCPPRGFGLWTFQSRLFRSKSSWMLLGKKIVYERLSHILIGNANQDIQLLLTQSNHKLATVLEQYLRLKEDFTESLIGNCVSMSHVCIFWEVRQISAAQIHISMMCRVVDYSQSCFG